MSWIAGQRARMRLRRGLRTLAAARMQQHHRLARRPCTPGRGQKVRRTADLLGIDHDGSGVCVVDEEVDHLGKTQLGLIAGGHHV
jgi:hypothetical protein